MVHPMQPAACPAPVVGQLGGGAALPAGEIELADIVPGLAGKKMYGPNCCVLSEQPRFKESILYSASANLRNPTTGSKMMARVTTTASTLSSRDQFVLP